MVEAKDYLHLSKASKEKDKKNTTENDVKMFVLADSASQHLTVALKGYAYIQQMDVNICEADYDQIDLQIFDENSFLYEYRPEYLLLYLCVQKLQEEFYSLPIWERKAYAEKRLRKIEEYVDCITAKLSNCRIIFPFFYDYDDKLYGNYAFSYEGSLIYQIKTFNYLIMRYAGTKKNFLLINMRDIASNVQIEDLNEAEYCNYKLSASLDVMAEMARQVISIVEAYQGRIVKCVILDLDNTLWGGVIGDDGIENIEIGSLGIGKVFSRFQLWLRELKRRGILLCVCSKNEMETAMQPFREHPEMILREDDIAMFVANWQDKAENIKNIQETLNIGMESIVFIDDNPFERAQVRDCIKEIIVPDMPDDPAMYISYLKSLNLFETVGISENDDNRTRQYKQEAGRTELQKKANDTSDFLARLSMIGQGEIFKPFYYSRIAQLTQRSNQFNLRTIRYTEQEVAEMVNDKETIPLFFTLKDSFGEYGLISVVILKICNNSDAFIDTWLMSCRVLKRGVEDFVLNYIVESLKKRNIKRIIGEYRETPKNKMVAHFYEEMGFSAISGNANLYELKFEDYVPHKHFIKEDTGND